MNESSEAKLHILDYWRVLRLRWALVLLIFFLVMITAGVTTYFLPRQFLSTVTMEVKQDYSGPVGSPFGGGGGGGQRGYDPNFVQTQFQILKTTEILHPVIKRLNLVEEYSKEGQVVDLQQVFDRLRRSLKLQEVRNTGLIEIGVFDTNAQRAANLANTIAVIYQENRREDLARNVKRGLSQIQEEVDKQKVIADQASAAATKIRVRDGIMDQDPERDSSMLGHKDNPVAFTQQQLNEQQSRVTQLKNQFELIQNLKPEELKEALRVLGIEDLTVQKILPQFQDAIVTEAGLLNSGLGERHPRVVSLRAQKEEYTKILSDQLESIKRGLANRLRLEQENLAAAEKRAAQSRTEDISEKTSMTEYIAAKSKAIQERKILETASMSLNAERIRVGPDISPARIWQKADRAGSPAKPNVPLYMSLAAVVGLVLGGGLAFFIEYLDTSVKTLDDIERYLQIPVLAVIPRNIPVLMNIAGDAPDAEAYRILRANIEFNKPHREANTFTLVSGGPGEGKSTTLNNLAFTCAKGGYNVLVVDADLRRATQQDFFQVDNTFGLTDYLLGRAEIDEIIKTTKIDNLSFIPSGELPEESVGILNSQRMTDLIAKVKLQYDLVFFDSPPILGVSDGSVLASECDISIMVVQHRRFPRAMLQRVKQAVHNVGGHLIGVVLNNVDPKHDEGYSYYNAYNEYYGAPRKPSARLETAPAQLARPRPASHEDY